MSLIINRRVDPDQVVLNLSGRIVFLDTSLREAVTTLIAEGHRNFVLDFGDVTHLDSFGMGQLVSILTSIKNQGGSLKLLHPNERVQKLLHITRLNSVFDIENGQSTPVG